jgi:anti-sigma-K factor RskA
MRRRRFEPHTLAGAYALDALTGADRARFERHLAGCPACAGEQRGLRAVTAALATATAAAPPAGLIEQAVAAAARTRQLPPANAGTRRWRPHVAWRSWQPVPRRLTLAIAAVFLTAAAASAMFAVTAERDLGAAQQADHAIAEVLTAPDAVMLTSRITGGGTATVVMSHHERSLVFTTAGLPPLPAGHCYQLWLMGPHRDRSVGLLPAPHAGMTIPVTSTGIAAGDRVGLTIEPAGGSPRPTSTPVLMLSLTT